MIRDKGEKSMVLKKAKTACLSVIAVFLIAVLAAAPAAADDGGVDDGYTAYSENIKGAVVTKTAVIYEEASLHSAIVKKLKFGGKMKIVSGNGSWYKVTCKSGTGYIPCGRVVRYDRKKKHIALTFDDGPNAKTTKKVVKALKSNGCRATFFVLGGSINKNTKGILKKAYKAGCEIGNHSYSHPQLTSLSAKKVKSQLSRTDKKVKKITGKKTSVCRAPYGAYSKRVLKAMGRPNIFWSVDTLDWKHRNTSRLIRVVKKQAKDGAVVLMHDIHPTTAAAVDRICKNLKKKGFESVTVTELAAIKGKKITKGHSYSRF